MCLNSVSSYCGITTCVLKTVYVCTSSPAVFQRPRRLQARTIIQQCGQAKVKLKPAPDGADAQWAEVGVLVCLFGFFFC